MDYLFSIHAKFANMIFQGSKTVELRTRKVQLSLPARLWIYVTTPEKELKGFATVTSVDHDKPSKIWKMHQDAMGLTGKQFQDYSRHKPILSAITISDVVRFDQPIALSRLREMSPLFHPPQFYMDLSAKPDFTRTLKKELVALRE